MRITGRIACADSMVRDLSWGCSKARARVMRCLLGEPFLFVPGGVSGGQACGVTVLASGASSSVAYYWKNRVALTRAALRAGIPVSAFRVSGWPDFMPKSPDFPADFLDTSSISPGDLTRGDLQTLLEGRWVIIVRHAERAWLRVLEEYRPFLAGLSYFMDDDLPGAALDASLPNMYALRLSLRFAHIRDRLAKLCDSVLFSTEELARRYAGAGASVLSPLPLAEDGVARRVVLPQPGSICLVFYHGTASHVRERAFVAELASMVQARRNDVLFEIMGSERALASFRRIPRVRRLLPLRWPDYLAHCHMLAGLPGSIGLAPLVPGGSFNSCRSFVKYFDITRCGAVGVYADVGAFRHVVEHGRNGLLAPMRVEAWAQAVLTLLDDADVVRGMARTARELVADFFNPNSSGT